MLQTKIIHSRPENKVQIECKFNHRVAEKVELFLGADAEYLRSGNRAMSATPAIENNHTPSFASGSNQHMPNI